MDMLVQLYSLLDAALIAPFRLFDTPLAGFLFGVTVLAAVCIVLGEYSMAWAYIFNRRHYKEQTEEMVRMHNLSIEAIRSKDKESYRAANKWANEHFGKSFFARLALFACSMWPVPFALGWLDIRFSGLGIMEVPFTSWQPGYAFFFIGLYILLRVAFAKFAKPRIPFFNRVVGLMQSETEREVKSWSELGPKGGNDGDQNTGERPVENVQDASTPDTTKDNTGEKAVVQGKHGTGKDHDPARPQTSPEADKT